MHSLAWLLDLRCAYRAAVAVAAGLPMRPVVHRGAAVQAARRLLRAKRARAAMVVVVLAPVLVLVVVVVLTFVCCVLNRPLRRPVFVVLCVAFVRTRGRIAPQENVLESSRTFSHPPSTFSRTERMSRERTLERESWTSLGVGPLPLLGSMVAVLMC